MKGKLQTSKTTHCHFNRSSHKDIAIIGMACRFPGAADYHQFWGNLIHGINSVKEIPANRWDWNSYYGDPKTETNKTNIKWGGFITDIDKFDPHFFNISIKEAIYMDPQHRIFLETAWHAIEDAGYSIQSLSNKKVGVYVGVSKNDYSELMRKHDDEISSFLSTGSVHSVIANRVSFLFNLKGQSEAIDTACSSALVSLHHAISVIQSGECELALVGGVNALITPTMFISHSKSGMLSTNGKCKTFDASADGYVRGEGVSAILLKPLDAAIADHDHIHGVIIGSAVNHGGHTNFLTSPSVNAQADVILTALANANVSAKAISYIETHGTGTPLGDPVEINGLSKAFGEFNVKETNVCGLGSVKPNLGHLESASGMASLIKVLLSMQHKTIPRTINFEKLNPHIEIEGSPFFIVDKNIPWETIEERRAGVSSFGMGGVNAHIILKEAPRVDESEISCPPDLEKSLLFVLSAKRDRLKNYAKEFYKYLSNDKHTINQRKLIDIAYTLQVGRDTFEERLAIIASSIEELINKLSHFINNSGSGAYYYNKLKHKKVTAVEENALRPNVGNFEEIAEKWVHGSEIQWEALYQNYLPYRMALPTYPFERKSCWIKPFDAQANKTVDIQEHEHVIQEKLSSKDYYIRDHVVQNQPVLPGVMYLELARSMLRAMDKDSVLTFSDIYWREPIIVTDQLTTELAIKLVDHKYVTTIKNGDKTNFTCQCHQSRTNAKQHQKINILEIIKRCNTTVNKENLYEQFKNSGLRYGESFRVIEEFSCNIHEAVALITLKHHETLEKLSHGRLEPSILDGALQTAVGLTLNGLKQTDGQYLPYYAREINIYSNLPPRCYAYIKAYTLSENKKSIKFDIMLVDSEDNILLEVKDFTKKLLASTEQFKAHTAQKVTTANCYYETEWAVESIKTSTECFKTKTLLLFDNDTKIADGVSKDFAIVIQVQKGNAFHIVEENNTVFITIVEDNLSHYSQLFEYVKLNKMMIDKIIYAWDLVTSDLDAETPDLIMQHFKLLTDKLLLFSKELIKLKNPSEIRLLYLYQNLPNNVNLAAACVAGFARTLQFENPKLVYVTVGIDDIKRHDLYQILLYELSTQTPPSFNEVRYSGNDRLTKIVRHMVDNQLSNKTPLFKKNGVYLITGGAGGLGKIFSTYLAQKYQANIILIGRSKQNTHIDQLLETINQAGGKVHYLSADITDKMQLEQVIKSNKKLFAHLNGVIHAAGVIEDAYIFLKRNDSFNKVLAPKVMGAINLDSLTKDYKLDLFLMCSSIAALIPNQGQCDYAAANSCLDEFSVLRNHLVAVNKRHGVTISLNWPLWAEGGMQVTPEEEQHLRHVFGMEPIATAAGLDVFERSLTYAAERSANKKPLYQLIAIMGDQAKIDKQFKIDHETLNESFEAVILNIIRSIFERELNVASDQYSINNTFKSLGIDSIAMLRITNNLKYLLQVDIKPVVFFDVNSIQQLHHYILEKYISVLKNNTQLSNFKHPVPLKFPLLSFDISNPKQTKYIKIIDPLEFYMDLVIDGQSNVPGAFYIEMARQAGELAGCGKVVYKLANSYWPKQLFTKEKLMTAYITLVQNKDGYDYEISSFSDTGESRAHAIGQIIYVASAADLPHPGRFDLDSVKKRCLVKQNREEIYRQIDAEGLHLGPNLMPMEEILVNESEALARCYLSEEITDTDYVLHPSSVTSVYQAALISNRVTNHDHLKYMPMAIDEVEIFRAFPRDFYIYVKALSHERHGTTFKKYDIVVCDLEGEITSRLYGLALKGRQDSQTAVKHASTIDSEVLAKTTKSIDQQQCEDYLKILIAPSIGVPAADINAEDSFEKYGINSVMIIELNAKLEATFGALSKTLFFEYANVAELAAFFYKNFQDKLQHMLSKPAAQTNHNERIDTNSQGQDSVKPTPITAPAPAAATMVKFVDLQQCETFLKTLIAPSIGVPAADIHSEDSFEKYGINSVMIIELNAKLEAAFGVLSKTLFFEYANVAELAAFFHKNYQDQLQHILSEQAEQFNQREFVLETTGKLTAPNVVKPSTAYNQQRLPETPSTKNTQDTHIAIIGVAGIYPDAKNLDEFWENLKVGKNSVTEIPKGRFEYEDTFNPDKEANQIYAHWGSFVADVDKFDAPFFNLSPKSAEELDPQARLFLEVAWNTIEDAGYTKASFDKINGKVGVFVGAFWQPYVSIGTDLTLQGNIRSANGLLYNIPNQVSYFFNFHGPSIAVDTACSSSLTALHLACESIRNGEVLYALAGGVNLSLHASKYLFLSQNRFLSTDGLCRSFGEGGDGYVPGEGVGVVLLKSLHQALLDGDHIYGVIMGSCVNHGGKTSGFTVPNPNAQAELLEETLKVAQVDPNTISYIEAHGTGTALGDPIEMTGLLKAYGFNKRDVPFAIGSLKSNIGHLEAAAGIAALTKVLLQMQHQTLVPSIHADKLNPNINWSDIPFAVQRTLSAWKRPVIQVNGQTKEYALRAGISSFGAGGSNAHMVVEEPPANIHYASNQKRSESVYFITLSAKTTQALKQRVIDLAEWLKKKTIEGTNTSHHDQSSPSLNDISYTLNMGRNHFEKRCAMVVTSINELQETLAAILQGQSRENYLIGKENRGEQSTPSDHEIRLDTHVSLEQYQAQMMTLAKRYVEGNDIDWLQLYHDDKPRRISLPTYPFAKKRYWLDSYVKSGRTEQKTLKSTPNQNDAVISPYHGNEVILEIIDNNIALIKMVDKANANMFTKELIHGMQAKLNEVKNNPQIKVVIITGYEKIFCMGGDKETLLAIAEHKTKFTDLPFIYKGLLECELPVIAAIQGHAHGGGFVFGLYADIIILSEESTYAASFMKYGFTPGVGATFIIKEKLGNVANEMMFTAKLFTGEELKERTGSVIYKPQEEVLKEAIRIAMSLAEKPLPALKILKKEMAKKILEQLPKAIQTELAMHEATFSTPEVKQRIKEIFDLSAAIPIKLKKSLSPTAPSSPSTMSSQPSPVTRRPKVALQKTLSSNVQKIQPQTTIVADNQVSVSKTNNISVQAIQDKLVPFVAEILHYTEPDLATNVSFSDLGVDSISAVEIIRYINKAFNLTIEAADIYTYPTIQKLSTLIAEKMARIDEVNASAEHRKSILVSNNIVEKTKKVLQPTIQSPQTTVPEAAVSTSSPITNSNPKLSEQAVQDKLLPFVAEILHYSEPDLAVNVSFSDLGVDSISAVEIIRYVNKAFHLSIEAADIYAYPTIQKLSVFIVGKISRVDEINASTENRKSILVTDHQHDDVVKTVAKEPFTPGTAIKTADTIVKTAVATSIKPQTTSSTTNQPAMPLNIRKKSLIPLTSNSQATTTPQSHPRSQAADKINPSQNIDSRVETDIAIIGVAGRFPDAKNVDEFWQNLVNGIDSVREVPKTRWDVNAHYDRDQSAVNKTYNKVGAFIEDFDQFEPLFFNISPQEAEMMDPQQCLFLEEAWKAIEDAGYTHDTIANLKCGVFVGATPGDYADILTTAGLGNSAYAFTGLSSSILSSRISYFLNLKGPSLTIDTACSSSLVALHEACKSILVGESDIAIAGGISLMLTPKMHIMTANAGMASPTGVCRTFDQSADGIVLGESVGVVVLKTLKQAQQDHDIIYGIIKASGINQDGTTNGITAPNPESQTALELEVYKKGNINPENISYVEAHGTGTPLGDPIEISALTQAFRRYTNKIGYCPIGSVKTNIGHTAMAAGITSLIKVLMALKHKKIPPTLHFNELNEHINLKDSPFYVNTKLSDWQPAAVRPRLAAISSFGFSGTNAHVVIEEAPVVDIALQSSKPAYLLTLSAKTEEALKKRINDLIHWIDKQSAQPSLEAISYTLNRCKNHFKKRCAIVVSSVSELKETIESIENKKSLPNVFLNLKKVNLQHQAIFQAVFKQLSEELANVSKLSAQEYRDKLIALADFYVQGYNLDWKKLHANEAQRKISLPSYPFARTRYLLTLNQLIDATPMRQKTETPENVSAQKQDYVILEKRWQLSTQSPLATALMSGRFLVLVNEVSMPFARLLFKALPLVEPIFIQRNHSQANNKTTNYMIADNQPAQASQLVNDIVAKHPDLIGMIDFSDLDINARMSWAKLAFLQAVVKQKVNDDFYLLYFTKGLQPFKCKQTTMDGAEITGLLRILGAEYSKLVIKTIDVESFDDIKQILQNELILDKTSAEICYRGGKRFLPTFDTIFQKSLTAIDAMPSNILVSPEKVYVITGGTRGIGSLLAQHLVNKGARRLVLMGLESLPPRAMWPALLNQPTDATLKQKISNILALEKTGAMIKLYAGPLTDQSTLSTYFNEIRANVGEIGGVFHCAGLAVSRNPAFINKEMVDMKKVCEPKLAGLLTLHEIFKEDKLDFFILFSTIAAQIPVLGIGSADYALANGFMDYFASFQREQGYTYYRSIAWPSWKDIGMGEVKSAPYLNLGFVSHDNQAGLYLLEKTMAFKDKYLLLPCVINNTLFNVASLLSVCSSAAFSKPKSANTQDVSHEQSLPWLAQLFSDLLKIPLAEFDRDIPFGEYGMDSILLAEWVKQVEKHLVNANIDPSIVLEYPTLNQLTDHIAKTYIAKTSSPAQQPVSSHAALTGSRETLTQPLHSPTLSSKKQIAVIGIACHFPGAENKDRFWQNLQKGHNSITEIPASRWSVDEFYHATPQLDKSISKWGGFIEGIEYFDPAYFAIPEEDAVQVDPLERQFLEVAAEVLCDAGYVKNDLWDKKVGVFVGSRTSNYSERIHTLRKNTIVGVGQNFIAAHVSHVFNFTGPSLVVDTACSSSLVSIHLACQSLLSGESDIALAGGVDILLDEMPYLILSEAKALSPDGRCHTFDEKANGFVPGEGAGVVLLKPLEKAIADNDHIYAVIEGSAMNNDGNTMGITTPNPKAQQTVIESALKAAGVSADSISYVETHGTGTMIGDPMELRALTAVFSNATNDKRFCAVGAVKSNIGHLLSAAGIASFIKVVLSLEHQYIVPTINCENPNPRFDFNHSPFFPNTTLKVWQPLKGRRRAGISSFGFGGTNAHIIVSELPSEVHQSMQHVRSSLPSPTFHRKRYWLSNITNKYSHVEMTSSIVNVRQFAAGMIDDDESNAIEIFFTEKKV